MKKANFIINHLTSSPSLKHVQKTNCYKKLLGLLPKSLQDGVRFVYSKNDTIFFVLEHPVYKMEFDYKMSLIKELLKSLVAVHKECSCIKASQIKTFVTNMPKFKNIDQETLPTYDEQSKGNFKNNCKNKRLYNLFEEIRECIKNSNKP